MHELHRVLADARDLVAQGWTQKGAAADKANFLVLSVYAQKAARFCAAGALTLATVRRGCAENARGYVERYTGAPLHKWNDAPERSQAEVIAMFNRVIFEEGGMSEAEYVLREARLCIEKGWTQGHGAHDAQGNPVVPNSPDAATFCARGALWRSCGYPGDKIVLFDKITAATLGQPIWWWNDDVSRTQEEVLAQFDIWIAEAHRNKYWGLE